MNITKRYFKANHGGIVVLTTTCEPTSKLIMRMTDRVDENGYIHRKTQEEAEKDPIPAKP